MKKSIMLIMFIVIIFNWAFWISFDNLIKSSVISFFSSWKFNKVYIDNFKYEGNKLANRFFKNKQINIKTLLKRNWEDIKIEQYKKINNKKIYDTLLYLLNILNKNTNLNIRITNILFQINWNINVLTNNNKNIFKNYFKILKNNINNKNIFLFKNKTIEEQMYNFYKNIYNFSILLNMVGDYLQFNNQINKDNIVKYFNWSYLYKINNKDIYNIIYLFDVNNNTNFIKYLNMFKILSN